MSSTFLLPVSASHGAGTCVIFTGWNRPRWAASGRRSRQAGGPGGSPREPRLADQGAVVERSPQRPGTQATGGIAVQDGGDQRTAVELGRRAVARAVLRAGEAVVGQHDRAGRHSALRLVEPLLVGDLLPVPRG